MIEPVQDKEDALLLLFQFIRDEDKQFVYAFIRRFDEFCEVRRRLMQCLLQKLRESLPKVAVRKRRRMPEIQVRSTDIVCGS
ncbi:MAG: hypothetical protein H0W53_00985 [Acidobacteria bacterium]|nr:hypothetical protein [Acidobacteriota bacterium]